MSQKIYISGLHSGQNPCAGVGIARSLRKAFPAAKLIGVDHWQGSSGLHHEAIDEILLLPQWKQMDTKRHVAFLRSLLDEGHVWISALDVEVYWLAQNFGSHKNLLAPSGDALERSSKPAVTAFESLGLGVPDYISAYSSDAEVHSFLRQNSWQCWLKGPYHDAKRITSWEAFERRREAMRKEWKTPKLFLQRHIVGQEESICFAAYQGNLVAAVHMQKRLITAEGKTWAGRVNPVSPELYTKLQKIVRALNWSGGAEIEYTQDADGKKWVIECNPRFPAWIYGAALAGVNLPGRLVAEACGLSFLESAQKYPCFTRVVQEIPAKESIGLPAPPDPAAVAWTTESEKGKGGPSAASLMPKLRNTMEMRAGDEAEADEDDFEPPEHPVTEAYQAEIEQVTRDFGGESPRRIHLEGWTSSRFELLAEKVKEAHRHPRIGIGYSVKTSPTEDHLRKALASGFYTECISQLEVTRAIAAGSTPANCILNGPGKFWPLTNTPVSGLHMLFCDSTEEMERVLEMPNPAKALGFRIRLPKLPSRFGVPIEDFDRFQKVLGCIRRMKSGTELGFHFHMPSWAIGVRRWKMSLNALIAWCQAIEQLTGKPVQHLDLGGGFFPSDLETIGFQWIQETIREALPSVKAIYFEPGRCLTQEGEAVVSRVLDVRRDSDGDVTEIVVDACIAELPLISSYAHRIFYRPASAGADAPVQHLSKGATKVLGRICMENDVLSAGLAMPASVAVGDLLVFGDAGAYERTMSYDFGRG